MATSPSSSTQLTLFTLTPSTYSSEEPPARTSPSPASAPESKATVAPSRWTSADWSAYFARAGWSGKTSPVSCRRTEDGRWEPSSGRWQNSGMGSPTACWTRSTSEWTALPAQFLNDEGVCSLSDVLEDAATVPRRFFLSPKACTGILRRSANRGKVLPPLLHAALERVANPKSTATSP